MQSIRTILLLAAVLLLPFGNDVHACLNEYITLLDGSITQDAIFKISPYDERENLSHLSLKEENYKKSRTIENYSDYATALIKVRRYAEAKAILNDIERRSPGRYITASNLGTLYELTGQNDSALHWISRAIKLNAKSHGGSEWIHVKILKYKIKHLHDANLSTESILSLDFGTDDIPVRPAGIDVEKLRRHLYRQLTERMSLVPPKDAIVAQLLFDLGNVDALESSVTVALYDYELATKYGYTSTVMLDRMSTFERMLLRAKVVNWSMEHIALISLSGVTLILAIGIFTTIRIARKRRLRHTS